MTQTPGSQDATEVLVVEDEVIIDYFFQGLIEELGCPVLGIARSRRDAKSVEAAARSKIATVDASLTADRDTREIVRDLVKRSDAKTIVTSDSHGSEWSEVVSLGAKAVGIKPCLPAHVEAKLGVTNCLGSAD